MVGVRSFNNVVNRQTHSEILRLPVCCGADWIKGAKTGRITDSIIICIRISTYQWNPQ